MRGKLVWAVGLAAVGAVGKLAVDARPRVAAVEAEAGEEAAQYPAPKTIYRVTWRQEGVEHVKDFVDIDNGYEFYQWMLRRASKVTWEHIAV
ncbi:hypothetical protein AB0F03_37850 [Streptomyces sp. NPDC028722]|uniref:hypothetical protein n=1 Tax=Streptomyces sp. NPDC028722 TaxID=3155016 RepID=UPI0033C4040E